MSPWNESIPQSVPRFTVGHQSILSLPVCPRNESIPQSVPRFTVGQIVVSLGPRSSGLWVPGSSVYSIPRNGLSAMPSCIGNWLIATELVSIALS